MNNDEDIVRKWSTDSFGKLSISNIQDEQVKTATAKCLENIEVYGGFPEPNPGNNLKWADE